MQCQDEGNLTVAMFGGYISASLSYALSHSDISEGLAILSSMESYAINNAKYVASDQNMEFSAHSEFWSEDKHKRPWAHDYSTNIEAAIELIMSYSEKVGTIALSLGYRDAILLLVKIAEHLGLTVINSANYDDHDSVLAMHIELDSAVIFDLPSEE